MCIRWINDRQLVTMGIFDKAVKLWNVECDDYGGSMELHMELRSIHSRSLSRRPPSSKPREDASDSKQEIVLGGVNGTGFVWTIDEPPSH